MYFTQIIRDNWFLGWARADYDPASGEIEVESPIRPEPWWAYARFRQVQGELQVAELRIFPGLDRSRLDVEDDEWPVMGQTGHWVEVSQLGPEVLRDLRIRDLRSVALTALPRTAWEAGLDQPVSKKDRRRHAVEAAMRPGRAGRDDRYYAEWAARYVARSGSKAPITDMAHDFGLRREQVRDLIHAARRRGLLGPGRAGLLTEKAWRLLEDQSE